MTLHNVLEGFQVLFGIILIGVILVQPGKSDGLNFISGGVSDTFYSKNKSRTHEAMQVKITIISAIIFAGITIALSLVKK